jgi:hypothetical protein
MASEDDRILRALETLRRNGLLALERGEPGVELRIGGQGYRCLPAFWEAVGAVAPRAAGFEQQVTALRDPFVRANLHHRVVAEFLLAGAPLWWSHQAAESALVALHGAEDTGGSGKHHPSHP